MSFNKNNYTDDLINSDKTDQNLIDKTKFNLKIDEGDRYNRFLKWLEKEGSKFPKLDMVSFNENVRGVVANQEILPNENIMLIPRSLLITIEMGMELDLGQKLVQSRLDFDAMDQIYLQIFVLLGMENPDCYYKPYFDTLPSDLYYIPIFWTENELKYLEGSYLLTQIAEKKEAIKSDYDAICRIDPTFSRFTLKQFQWARMIVTSRNFTISINGKSTAALVPLADMLNHYRPRETNWDYSDEYEAFVITSFCRISCGHQVYDSYGPKCNYRYLLNYGFAVYNNIESPGRSPNEVFCQFKLASSDEFYERKRKFLLHSIGNTVKSIRITASILDDNTRSLFQFLRLILARGNELDYIERQFDIHGSYMEGCKEVINCQNELDVLALLKHFSIQRLSLYPTTMEEDQMAIDSGDLGPFSNKYHATVMVHGEKKIYHHFINLYEFVSNLFRNPCSINEIVRTTCSTIGEVNDYCYHMLYEKPNVVNDNRTVLENLDTPYEDYIIKLPLPA